jgi:hypothetical protein
VLPRPIRRREQDAVALGARPRGAAVEADRSARTPRRRQAPCGRGLRPCCGGSRRVGRNPARASIEPLGIQAPAANPRMRAKAGGSLQGRAMDSDVAGRTRGPKDRLDRRHVDRPVGSPGSGSAPTTSEPRRCRRDPGGRDRRVAGAEGRSSSLGSAGGQIAGGRAAQGHAAGGIIDPPDGSLASMLGFAWPGVAIYGRGVADSDAALRYVVAPGRNARVNPPGCAAVEIPYGRPTVGVNRLVQIIAIGSS